MLANVVKVPTHRYQSASNSLSMSQLDCMGRLTGLWWPHVASWVAKDLRRPTALFLGVRPNA